jgi:glycosyltransferase involved in cell wall biosynthesis
MGNRVLLYSDGGVFGGAERYLLELAGGLDRQRFSVGLVCSDAVELDDMAREGKALGAEVWRIPPIPTLKATGPFLRALRFFTSHRADILHFNLTDPRSCNGAMTAARAVLRKDFVVTEHLPMARFDGRPLPFRHRLAAKNTVVTIVLNEPARHLVANRPHFRGRIEVVANGVADPGDLGPDARRAARAELGCADHDGPLVGWIGRFIPQKDPALMVEGILRIAPERPDARFLFLGEGPHVNATRARLDALGLLPHCRFLGFLANARHLICGMDLLVNTSRFEGMPLTILEAMMAGVPVVAPSLPGMDEVVGQRATGFLFTPGDGDALGHALYAALCPAEWLAMQGRAARARARALFSLARMCSRTAGIYDSLL